MVYDHVNAYDSIVNVDGKETSETVFDLPPTVRHKKSTMYGAPAILPRKGGYTDRHPQNKYHERQQMMVSNLPPFLQAYCFDIALRC